MTEPLSNETLLAVLQERIAALAANLNSRIDEGRIQNATLADNMQQLNLRERERNGNINKIFERQKAHDEWHGENDTNIVGRVSKLEGEDHDAEVRRRLLAVQWKILASGLAGGAALMAILREILVLVG